MSTACPLYLGLDVGTQSVRAALFDAAAQAAGPFVDGGWTGRSSIPTTWSRSTLIVRSKAVAAGSFVIPMMAARRPTITKSG